MTFNQSEVRSYFAARAPRLRQNGHELRGPCPVHDGKDPNFSVNLETGLAFCHSQCGRGWDLISLESELSGLDFIRAKKAVFDAVGRPIPRGEENVEAYYDYIDEHGEVLYQVLRLCPKDFRQRRPNPAGGWQWGLGRVTRVPFHLPQLIQASFVLVCEGEKDVLAAERLGVAATCCNGGSDSGHTLDPKWFAGKDIAIIPDNDDPGRKYAMTVAALLHSVAKSVKIVELPDLAHKGDLCDWIRAGGTLPALRSIYKTAPIWTPAFEFGAIVAPPGDKFLHTFSGAVSAAGGLPQFFDLTRQSGLPTPWRRLNNALGGGMRQGEVYLLGANQGAGKTSLALQFATHAMYKHKGVLIFSMEMGPEAVFQRMASIEARVNLNDLRRDQLIAKGMIPVEDADGRAEAGLRADSMSQALFARARELQQLPLTVCTASSITPEYLREEAARIAQRGPIHLVVVDHMQLMSATGKAKSDYEKFTGISRATKQVAVDLNVPLVVVSQTSRSQSRDNRTEIECSDLRGSGALEEDAAAVLLLYPDKEDSDLAKSQDNGQRLTRGPLKSWLKIGKNRYGEGNKYFELLHFKTTTHFEEPGE